MNVEFHIFGFWEVIVEVEFFDVSDETFSSWSGNDTVEDTFCGGDGRRGSHWKCLVSAEGSGMGQGLEYYP